jgi:nucleoside-diphosphate-sugar epimerase
LFGIVDVRDVALAHLRSIEREDAKGKRFILVSKEMWRDDMAKALKTEYESQGYNIVTEMEDGDDFGARYDTSASRNILGLEYRETERSLVEMAESMIKSGMI